jgi:hypothetical protein
MTLEEIRNSVYSTLGERPEDDFFSDDEINRWINEGQMKAVIDSDCLQTTTTLDTNDQEVELPSDFIKEYKVLLNDEIIDKVPFHLRNKRDGYYIWEDDLHITYADGEITLYYLREPTKLTDDLQEPDIPTGYSDILIDYAVYKARQKDKQFDMAEVHRRDFKEGVEKLRERYGRKPARRSWKVERL